MQDGFCTSSFIMIQSILSSKLTNRGEVVHRSLKQLCDVYAFRFSQKVKPSELYQPHTLVRKHASHTQGIVSIG